MLSRASGLVRKGHHPQLLKDCLTVLATHGWERSTSDSFADQALDNLLLKFSVSLENAGVDMRSVCEEWKDMLEYAKQYLNLVQEPIEVTCGNNSMHPNCRNASTCLFMLSCLQTS